MSGYWIAVEPVGCGNFIQPRRSTTLPPDSSRDAPHQARRGNSPDPAATSIEWYRAAQLDALVRTRFVVIGDVLLHHAAEVPFAHDPQPVQASSCAERILLAANALARGARSGVLLISMPSASNTLSQLGVYVAARSRIKNSMDNK